MKTSRTAILLFLLALIFVSCQQENLPVLNPVEFDINQPIENAIYNYGDTVFIESLISWENELHGYEVFIKQLDNDSIVFNTHAHNDSHQMNIYKIWVNKVKVGCQMKLIIKAYTSHEEQWETSMVNFTCLPMK